VQKKWKLSWEQVALVGIVAAIFVGSYFLPDGARSELHRDVALVWGAIATFLRPLLRREVSADGASK